MSNEHQNESKPNLKSTLLFFNSNISSLNNQRQQFNRSKGMAKYLAQSKPLQLDLTPIDTTLGVMSFALYMLRFSFNFCLLIELMGEEEQENTLKTRRELYYSLFNDCLWSAVNLAQFFWLSFRNSSTLGFRGLQLEVLAQFIDVLVMMMRFCQEKEAYQIKYQQADALEKTRLTIEWQVREVQFIRALITATSIATTIGLFAFSVSSAPISPIIFTIVIISSLLRVLIDIAKDQYLKKPVVKENRASTQDRLNDINQIVLYNILSPLGLFILITTPPPLSLLGVAGMLFIHLLSSYLINTKAVIQPVLATEIDAPMPIICCEANESEPGELRIFL